MDTDFDIFKRLVNGNRFWIACVPGIKQARARINRLKVIAPGEYLIYSEREGRFIETVTINCRSFWA
jgi:hypothetical protein